MAMTASSSAQSPLGLRCVPKCSGHQSPTLPLTPAHSKTPRAAPTGTFTWSTRSPHCSQAPGDSMCIWICSKIMSGYLQLVQTAKAHAPPGSISETSRSPGLCPCKITGRRRSWDPARSLISAELSSS